jgi:hypothetical protein
MKKTQKYEQNILICLSGYSLKYLAWFFLGIVMTVFITHALGASSLSLLLLQWAKPFIWRIALVIFCLVGLAGIIESIQ